ncbi:hypothetical protein F8M41_003998 [Gigaspora margarita]|uniref:Uncharacterized protein n=1 Tax=Gigaspora margarita TaxID=4874 RepID=A0A8H4ES59_GIGMA|nr:hypothetical protein F8M41_003998 [Gigaspora margarita]
MKTFVIRFILVVAMCILRLQHVKADDVTCNIISGCSGCGDKYQCYSGNRMYNCPDPITSCNCPSQCDIYEKNCASCDSQYSPGTWTQCYECFCIGCNFSYNF